MAYKNLVITPPQYINQDATKQSQFYRGFSTINNTTKSVALYDTELIKQDLINQFSTKKGERLMHPEFGTIIWDIIFDPLTDILKQSIIDDVDTILASDPRISPIQVLVIEKDYGILIEASVTYTNSNQVDNLRINFDKELGLPTIQ
jgi:phage baseplate assembly protein W